MGGRRTEDYSTIQKKLSFWTDKKLSCWDRTKVNLYTTKLCGDSIRNDTRGLTRHADSHASRDASSTSHHRDTTGRRHLQCQQ